MLASSLYFVSFLALKDISVISQQEKRLLLWVLLLLQKGPAKPKKSKEVEKAKPEEKAPEAPAENGEAKAEEDVRVMELHTNKDYWCFFSNDKTLNFVLQAPATDAAEQKDEAAE